jgi:hypothetical protein
VLTANKNQVNQVLTTNLLLPPEIAAVAEKFTLANGY